MVVDGGSSWEGPQSTAFATKSALHLCNLYFKHLPQKLHFTVLKVPHRPRNLHFKVHELLHLPRNLHFKVHKVMHLPQKLLPHLPRCHEMSRNLLFKVHKVLHLPRNLHFKVHKVLRPPQFPKTNHMCKSHDSPHLSQNQSTSKITTMSKVLRLPRNLHIEVKPLRSLVPVARPPKHEVSRARATKSDHHARKCARHHNERSLEEHLRQPSAVEMHFEDFERRECAVNSNELAGRPDATPRLNSGP